uniref:Flavin-containing monooxygenase n=1 Tax=Panagrolaimus sp. JU765 TaxID=591449 RepID=A0AC34Q3L2_9BILA
MEVKKRVAIVGAGASGLPAIRHAVLYGIEPVCFELTDGIGGLWRYKEKNRNVKGISLSSVMKTTVINSSKEMTAYSDFPPPAEAANFMHNREMLQYFEDYAKHYDLKRYIKFNHKVEKIERADNYTSTGKWKVVYLDEDNDSHTEIFDGVLLATGHHAVPHWPKNYPGQSEFTGKLMHAHDYTDHRGFEDKTVVIVGIGNSGGDLAVELSRIAKQVYLDKTVVIVGIGNSGGDLAVELSRIAKQVYLVTRRGSWILNRLTDGGYPFDAAVTKRFDVWWRSFLPLGLLSTIFERKMQQKFDHSVYGLKPKHRIASAHPTVNDELPNRLASRTVKIKPNILKFKNDDIIFDDLTDAENVDVVIFATGYWFDFPLVENGELISVVRNDASLYLNMFSPDLSDFNSLAILGLIQPLGSIMPISEMQSRVFFAQFSGQISLPSKESMVEWVSATKAAMKARYVESPRHTIQVDYDVYMDQLADLIGCRPNILKHLWKDPALGQKLLTGPITAYTYRLDGPHPWQNARETILTTEFRIKAGMAPEGESAAMSRNLDLYMQPIFPSFKKENLSIFDDMFFHKKGNNFFEE